MRTVEIIKYIADDGKEFDEYEDCIRYEFASKRSEEIIDDLTLLDFNRKELTEWKSGNNKKDFGQAYYVSADSNAAAEFFNEVCKEYGLENIPGSGTWYYDENDREYKSLEKLRRLVEEIEEAFAVCKDEM